MIHVILRGQRAGEMAKALFFAGESLIHPFSLEPTFVGCFRIFSKLEVVTPEDQKTFYSMLAETSKKYGEVIVEPDVGAFLGFAGHWPYI